MSGICKPSLSLLLMVFCTSGMLSQFTDEDICSLDSCSSLMPQNGSVEKFCKQSKGLRMRGRCCLNLTDENKIVGVDLSFCNVSNLENLSVQARNVVRLNLTNNPFLKTTNNTFRGLRDLKTLSLPVANGCPGNTSRFNTSWRAWNKTETHRHMVSCFNQTDTCANLKMFNYTCPANSACQTDGPGLFRCECEENWTGYKCVRLALGNPDIAIVGGSVGSALLLSVFFWFSDRRYVIGR